MAMNNFLITPVSEDVSSLIVTHFLITQWCPYCLSDDRVLCLSVELRVAMAPSCYILPLLLRMVSCIVSRDEATKINQDL